MIEVQKYTTKNPITMIGYEAGVCYNSDISDDIKNYKRGIDCIESEHGRALEFPQIYLTIDGYSARCIRELYTHIGGMPTRLQESTRYIKYDNFDYYIPQTIKNNEKALKEYTNLMNNISDTYGNLLELGIVKEDIANILPLGMRSKIVIRTNLRQLIDMMATRQCSRAYIEMRKLMKEIKEVLREYSEEWKVLVDKYMPCKCDIVGYCKEKKSCGKYPRRENNAN